MSTKYAFDYTKYRSELIGILNEIAQESDLTWGKFRKILSRYPKDGNSVFSKNHLVVGYQGLLKEKNTQIHFDEDIIAKIQMKPVRTQSGVTTVTVLTKPFPCPGKCIFCPNDIRMPKSYLADEPGAQRAERNKFDPYLQTYHRLEALHNIGHNVSKVELIILGGTWSYYPEDYQIWFVKRCFEALNDFGDGLDKTDESEHAAHKWQYEQTDLNASEVRSKTYNRKIGEIARDHKVQLVDKNQKSSWDELTAEHKRNETNKCRNVGLVIETRPDNISPEEVIRIRKLGCTKTQIGVQSLDDHVLELNNRGHDVAATKKAFELLRYGGFKIHAHWMANLYGSNLEKDIADYGKLFAGKDFHPDELKVYPCSLIETAELMDYYNNGLWKPYDYDQMSTLLTEVIQKTPEYCRLTRVVREFSSKDIVDGNKLTNFRQIAERNLDNAHIRRNDIRSREIGSEKVNRTDLKLSIVNYHTSVSEELFLQFVTKENRIAGFLRLSLPVVSNFVHPFLSELNNTAMIREIHVYGKSLDVGSRSQGKAQHLGLGTELIEEAKRIAHKRDFARLGVISAVGTREYYRKKGFVDGELYQYLVL